VVDEEPLVTVVIPVWGEYVSRYLSEALQSVRAQDLSARVVLVDNASEIPVDPEGREDVVRLPKRVTVGAARNAGLAVVKSPFVIFWDADDVMLPGTLRALTDRALSDPTAAVISGVIVEADNRRRHHWPRKSMNRLVGVPWLFLLGHCVWSLFPTIGVLIRADVARLTGGFPNADAGDDWVLGVSLAFRGCVVFVERSTRLYRSHDQSVSVGWQSSHLVASARCVRDRIRSDSSVPHWVKTLLPLIAILQWTVIYGFRRVARITRRVW
jgi:glycosyltransferase involved in cell wall biosynthesis